MLAIIITQYSKLYQHFDTYFRSSLTLHQLATIWFLVVFFVNCSTMLQCTKKYMVLVDSCSIGCLCLVHEIDTQKQTIPSHIVY